MMPNSMSDATHFLCNGPHMFAASVTQYLAWSVLTRCQCYDIGAWQQRQALLTTSHMTPRSVSDALYFLDYGQHLYAAGIRHVGVFVL